MQLFSLARKGELMDNIQEIVTLFPRMSVGIMGSAGGKSVTGDVNGTSKRCCYGLKPVIPTPQF